jgi:hypothetical protein
MLRPPAGVSSLVYPLTNFLFRINMTGDHILKTPKEIPMVFMKDMKSFSKL